MELLRCITILLALYGIYEYLKFYIKKRQPVAFAPMSWLILVLGYTIFKWVVGADIEFYSASVIWSNVILIQGIIILIAALVIFRGVKFNGK
jgi:hypothetical protein